MNCPKCGAFVEYTQPLTGQHHTLYAPCLHTKVSDLKAYSEETPHKHMRDWAKKVLGGFDTNPASPSDPLDT